MTNYKYFPLLQLQIAVFCALKTTNCKCFLFLDLQNVNTSPRTTNCEYFVLLGQQAINTSVFRTINYTYFLLLGLPSVHIILF